MAESSLPRREEQAESGERTVELSAIGQLIDARLEVGDPEGAARLAPVILRRFPRHLATYQRLIESAWMLKRWQEGEDWARRLLQADPGNPIAWRSLAFAVEQKGMRNAARAMWRRAFESYPYDPEIRVGLSRTSLVQNDPLSLNAACLASLYLRGCRWSHAANNYRVLVQADERRIDFQVNWMAALWKLGARQDAYGLARHLTQRHPLLLLAWVVLADLGNVDDQALTRNPINAMDPDGEFVRLWFDLPFGRAPVPIRLSPAEAALIDSTATG